MFIPSIYKSAPQIISVNTTGAHAISSVDPNYTRLAVIGQYGSHSGAVNASMVRVEMTDATHFTSYGSGVARVLVEEFLPSFFRQAFQYGTVTIASGATTGNTAHGLTLGSKAFICGTGSTSTRTADGGAGLALAEDQAHGIIYLNGANVSAECGSVDYAGGPGTVTIGYCLIDPR